MKPKGALASLHGDRRARRPMTPPLVFLSHSGADAEPARALKRRLMDAPDAKAAGLKVWFDKDALRPGTSWSAQIAEAIQNQATAFLVYVGSGGVMNWVEAEVELALSRATTSKPSPLLFIPVLDAKSQGSSALPPFAKRYQGVRDPLCDGDELGKLLAAVLDLDSKTTPILIEEPFVGLRAMREEESDRFFGRKAEIAELTEKFRKHRLVAVVADSGTGKSSLARAGFAPAFRGGALIEPMREEAREKIRQVVTMRPRGNPVEGLRDGVEIAARILERSQADVASLRASISIADAGEIAFALRCGLPPDKTSVLLIVDQFEELLTATSDKDAASFAALLLALADGASDVRILLTVRSDYFNLASGVKDADGRPALFERLTAGNNDAVLRLKAMPAAGLSEAVLEPLKLAGVTDATALANAVQTDISDQASDLPLLQVALRAAWQDRRKTHRPMLECYQSVGRVSGALAKEADKARDRLPAGERALLDSIFVRLVRLGDTGGATRLGASLADFDPPRRALVQKLGEDEYGRLVSVGATHVELAHEALITQWPWLQGTLKTHAADVRRLARLMERAKEWSAAPDERKAGYLAARAERELFDDLASQRLDWLSEREASFVDASNKAYREERDAAARDTQMRVEEQARQLFAAQRLARAERSVARRTLIGLIAALALAALAIGFATQAYNEGGRANAAAKEAIAQRQTAVANLSVALTALADIEADKHPVSAAKLALAAWPRDNRDLAARPRLGETLDALGRIVPDLRERRVLKGHEENVTSAAFSADGTRVVTASDDKTARVWDAATGRELAALKGHEGSVRSAAFSGDGTRVVTASFDKTARVWDAATGRELAALKGHEGPVHSAAFSGDGTRVVTASYDKTARVWDAATGRELAALKGHEGSVRSAAFSGDGTRVVTASDDKTARVWDAATGRELAALKGHEGPVLFRRLQRRRDARRHRLR